MQSSANGREGGFTCLPNWLFGQATAQELVLLLALQHHAPKIHPSLATLARESGLGRSTVCRLITVLEERGWLRTERRFADNGGNNSTVYHLLIWPVRSAELEPTEPMTLVPQRDYPLSHSGTTLIPERDHPCPTAGHKQYESKNKNENNSLRPPLPPSGGNAGEGQGELITVEALPVVVPVDAALSKSPESAKVPEPPPQTMALTKPARKPRFQPSHDLIPAELLPVHPEILGFWAVKAGARTQQAWNGLMTQLALIQQDPLGGTEALRSQLQEGIDRAPIKPWMSVTHSLWRTYGMKGARPGLGGNRRKTPEEHAADSIAFIEARDARRAAAASAPGQTVPCEVLA
jgi:hypothetical protein